MPTELAPAADALPHYAFKPSLLGPAWEFRLAEDALEWEVGRRHGRIPYGDVRRLRMSFRPATMQTHRFVTEIWPTGAPKVQIASTSWRSMVEQQRQDADYAGFVAELHRRIAAAHPNLRCESGIPALTYWPGLAVFVLVVLGLAALIVRAVQTQAWAGAVIVGCLLALFLVQSGAYFKRNRPGVYAPSALPAAVLPRL